MHELIDGGISALIDELEQGKSLGQAINAVTWDSASTEIGTTDVAVGHRVSDIQDVDSFIEYFNNSTDVDTYLTNSTDFTLGSGAIVHGNVKGSSGNLTQDATIPNETGTSVLDALYNLSFGNSGSLTNYIPGSSGGSITLQIGANTAQSMSFQLHDLRSSSLGLKDVSVSTRSDADSSIASFNSAIEQVSSVRSYYGVIQNRLEHTIANLSNAEENLTAAESRIRDADMAKEMMNFQKNNILAQAAQAMLAQANQLPQGVLQLLR
ncbi:MAG: hypothetical protein HGJ98_20670 [Desulfosporosinus sp.]|nr:hypothetical protein [Desulfosporosinus sp.]MBC2728847.1 hypothetical protein [Desulfosporosinus sp.]